MTTSTSGSNEESVKQAPAEDKTAETKNENKEKEIPVIDYKTLKYYDFESADNTGNIKEFIVQLDDNKVEEAKETAKKEFMQSIKSFFLKLLIIIIILGILFGLIYYLYKIFSK